MPPTQGRSLVWWSRRTWAHFFSWNTKTITNSWTTMNRKKKKKSLKSTKKEYPLSKDKPLWDSQKDIIIIILSLILSGWVAHRGRAIIPWRPSHKNESGELQIRVCSLRLSQEEEVLREPGSERENLVLKAKSVWLQEIHGIWRNKDYISGGHTQGPVLTTTQQKKCSDLIRDWAIATH